VLVQVRSWAPIKRGIKIMSMKCDVCGKKPLTGNNISHSNIKTKKRSLPNIQKIKAEIDGVLKKINICTRCIRTGKVNKAV